MGHPFCQVGAKKAPQVHAGADRPFLAGNYLYFFTGTPPVRTYTDEERFRHFGSDPYYVCVPEVVTGADPWTTYPTALTPSDAKAAGNRALGVVAAVGAAIVGAVMLGIKKP
ncbi:MAG: hypothetical protein ACHREM_12210 [Polyangiales bacterium]